MCESNRTIHALGILLLRNSTKSDAMVMFNLCSTRKNLLWSEKELAMKTVISFKKSAGIYITSIRSKMLRLAASVYVKSFLRLLGFEFIVT